MGDQSIFLSVGPDLGPQIYKAAWSAGRARAEDILQAHHVGADFTEVFSHANVDML
jgi:hypothetical protein